MFPVVVDAVLGGFEGVAGIFEFFGFAVRGAGGCQDAVFYEQDAQAAEFLFDPDSDWGGEVGFYFVDLRLLGVVDFRGVEREFTYGLRRRSPLALPSRSSR